MKVAIIGGGPAGMTAAYQISKKLGKEVTRLDVYEKNDRVGGLSRSLDLWKQRVDLGPHRFFSHDPDINALWLEVVQSKYGIVNRQTRIYYKKRFFNYPIKAFNALRGL
ncbi:MAG: NAD(P)-binding protein, partial [Bacteroidales bacterium]